MEDERWRALRLDCRHCRRKACDDPRRLLQEAAAAQWVHIRAESALILLWPFRSPRFYGRARFVNGVSWCRGNALLPVGLRPIHVAIMEPRGLRVLLFQKMRGVWVARGLEHDLSVEGRSLESVVDSIHRLVNAHADFDRRHGRVPLSPFPAAPSRYWQAFERAQPLAVRNEPSNEPDFGPIFIAVSSEDPIEPLQRTPRSRGFSSPEPQLQFRQRRPVH